MEPHTLGLPVHYEVTIPTTLSRFAGVIVPYQFFTKGAPKCEWWRFNDDVPGGGIYTIRT